MTQIERLGIVSAMKLLVLCGLLVMVMLLLPACAQRSPVPQFECGYRVGGGYDCVRINETAITLTIIEGGVRMPDNVAVRLAPCPSNPDLVCALTADGRER